MSRICLLILVLLAHDSSQLRAQGPSAEENASVAVAINLAVSEHRRAAISPDGRWLYYQHQRSGFSGSPPRIISTPREMRVRRIGLDGRPDGEEIDVRSLIGEADHGREIELAWAPDSRLIVRTQTRNGRELTALTSNLIDLATGVREPFEIRALAPGLSWDDLIVAQPRPGDPASRRTAPVQNLQGQWSSDGRYYAFLGRGRQPEPVAPAARPNEEPGQNVPMSARVQNPRLNFSRAVYLLDRRTGMLSRPLDSALDLYGFALSPDGLRAALEVPSASDRDVDGNPRSDLILLDLQSGAVSPLVTTAGRSEVQPRWSPDGRALAFLSFSGGSALTINGNNHAVPRLDVLDLASRQVRSYEGHEASGPVPFGAIRNDAPRRLRWHRSGRRLSYPTAPGLRMQLRSFDIGSGVSRLLPLPEILDGDEVLVAYDEDIFGRVALFDLESAIDPGGLYLALIDHLGRPIGPAHPVFESAARPLLRNRVSAQIVQWPSADGAFTIEGLLYLPRNSRAPRAGRLPAVIAIRGGPGQVAGRFGQEFGEEFVLAARGYAVLVPATRGREGYTEDFARAIERSGRYGGPYQDLLGGLRFLESRDEIDPDRIGIFGHSYGGGLAAYALTQSTRFRAAIIHEGGNLHQLNAAEIALSDFYRPTYRSMYGYLDPYSPVERERRLEESPLLNANQIRTPTLLLYGGVSPFAEREGMPFFTALSRQPVPVVGLMRNEMAHGPADDVARSNFLEDLGQWFDHWLQGLPYPEGRRRALFESWRTNSGMAGVQAERAN